MIVIKCLIAVRIIRHIDKFCCLFFLFYRKFDFMIHLLIVYWTKGSSSSMLLFNSNVTFYRLLFSINNGNGNRNANESSTNHKIKHVKEVKLCGNKWNPNENTVKFLMIQMSTSMLTCINEWAIDRRRIDRLIILTKKNFDSRTNVCFGWVSERNNWKSLADN